MSEIIVLYRRAIGHLITVALYAFISGANLFVFLANWTYNGVPSWIGYLNLAIALLFGGMTVVYARLVRSYIQLAVEWASDFEFSFEDHGIKVKV